MDSRKTSHHVGIDITGAAADREDGGDWYCHA
jgi:hypothetical protein